MEENNIDIIVDEEEREALNNMCYGANKSKLGDVLYYLQQKQYSDGIEWADF